MAANRLCFRPDQGLQMRFDHLRRRQFIRLIGGAAASLGWLSPARSQQAVKMHRFAIVHPSVAVEDMNESSHLPTFPALFKELGRLNYVEGQNLAVERYAGKRQANLTDLARDVVATRPDVIFASSNPVVLSVKAMTETIPIVGIMADPVAYGLAASLARPGGNITGISSDAGLDIWGKRLQVLQEAIATVSRVGFLTSRLASNQLLVAQMGAMRDAGRQLNISLVGPPLESPVDEGEYRRVFREMAQERVDGVIVSDYATNFVYRQLIVDLAAEARLPTVYPFREYFEVGGLMAYGSSVTDLYTRAAGYIDKIIKGGNAAEVPIYLEQKFELLINMRKAKALGLTIPTSLLVRADEVID
jgi:putative tryptophan/tyrosine transport system substrate-binding protein